MIMGKILAKGGRAAMNSLKLFRLTKLGMSQKELGEKVGLTQPQIAQIEQGKRGKRFKDERMKILREMGYKGEVTDNIDITKFNGTQEGLSLDKKARKIIAMRTEYRNKVDYLKDFLDVFNVGLFIGANSIGDVSLSVYYKGKEIYRDAHRNGCSVSAK